MHLSAPLDARVRHLIGDERRRAGSECKSRPRLVSGGGKLKHVQTTVARGARLCLGRQVASHMLERRELSAGLIAGSGATSGRAQEHIAALQIARLRMLRRLRRCFARLWVVEVLRLWALHRRREGVRHRITLAERTAAYLVGLGGEPAVDAALVEEVVAGQQPQFLSLGQGGNVR